MSTLFTSYLLRCAGAALGTAVALPAWRAWCRRVGLVDEPGRRKLHEQSVPLAGGLAVLTGLLLSLLALRLAVGLRPGDSPFLERLAGAAAGRGAQLWVLLGGAIAMTLLGWIDDRHELRPAWKFSGQFAVALLVATAGVRLPEFGAGPLPAYLLTLLWILTVTNAANFTDNMDGLCAGLGMIAAGFFACVAGNESLTATAALLTAGAVAGFLPWNFPRASAFLGDAGSHLAGYLLAILPLLPQLQAPPPLPHARPFLTSLLFLAVPLSDLVSVVFIRWRHGQPFYVGDNNHFSHRLVRRGFTPVQAVMILWTVAATAGAVGLLLH